MSKPVMSDLFTFSGRRNRKSYFFYVLLVMLYAFVGSVITLMLVAIMPTLGFIAAALMFIPVTVSSWAVGGQRCRDFGWTGWAVLLTMIPYVGLIVAVAFMVVPGTIGDNRYGADLLEGKVA